MGSVQRRMEMGNASAWPTARGTPLASPDWRPSARSPLGPAGCTRGRATYQWLPIAMRSGVRAEKRGSTLLGSWFLSACSAAGCWGAAMGLWAARHSVAGNSGRGFFPAQTGVFQGTRGARTSADLCGRALRADPPSSVCHLAISLLWCYG
ncbi:hypothetical protein BJ166DRAFT_373151 [Pestalotiopsis sp. NC0098]|nr:hypothetical protein BJ166DRAFT_373151 [Pestalotiopsis sp. NC0098]